MFKGLTSSLASFGFGAAAFPYKELEAYPSAWGGWTHHRGTSDADNSPVSIFKISAADPNDRKLVVARNGIKRLKMLRHPNLLAFKDSQEVTEKGMTVLYMVTQAVRPLESVLQELNLEGEHRWEDTQTPLCQQATKGRMQPYLACFELHARACMHAMRPCRDQYLAMCILHMTNAVSFLNNDCKLIHGGISLDAVVVTATLDPKLHGFDLLSELSLPGDFPLQQASWAVADQYKPAELARGEWEVIRQSPPWAVDAWGLGCLIQEICACRKMQSVEDLRRTDVIPAALLGDYQKLLSSSPPRRLNPSKV
jgi:SCY1-like protein 1